MRLPDAVCYEALFNVFLVFKRADLLPAYLQRMKDEKVHMTAYVVNTLMKVYASAGDIQAARDLFESLVDPAPGLAGLYNHPNSPHGSNGGKAQDNLMVDGRIYREPSCYETIIRIEFGAGHLENVMALLDRLIEREYPVAIVNRIKKIVNL
jgi:pentatricopeptide repeat protein